MSQVCVITGGTSGIGRCTAQAMLARGYTVYELSRRAEGVAGMQHIVADVTKEETLAAAVAQILQWEDHIDVLINNAGFGISGAVEFTGTEEAQRQLDVNFFGMVRMNRQVLPVMRKQGYGRIVNLGNDTRHQNRNDILAYLVQHLPVGLFLLAVGRLDKFVMLCGNHNRVHADRFPVVVIFNRHLAFGVGTQISHFFAFAPYFGQYTQDFVAEVEG